MDHWTALATMTGAVGSFVLVILSWINSNARATRLEQGQDRMEAALERTRSELRTEFRTELRAESSQTRSELRSEIVLVRNDVGSLRDLVYREMVSLHERVAAVEAKRE